jgi:uncharacterized membrane protein
VTQVRKPIWPLAALLAIAVAGIAISSYLTATHARAIPLVCTVGSLLNCSAVTQSAYSVIPGTTIPISALGIVWFLVSGVMALLAWLAVRSERLEARWLAPVHFAWSAVALLVVLYLVYVEIVLLHRICEWCTVVHLLVLTTFVLTLRRLQGSVGRPSAPIGKSGL